MHKLRPRKVLAILALIGLALPALAGEKTLLQYKAKAGNSSRVQTTINMEIDAGGQKLTLVVKQSEKLTYKAVAPNGNLTIEHLIETIEQTMNGEKMDSGEDEKPKPTETVVQPDGTVISTKSEDQDSEMAKIGVRIANGTTIIFSNKPVEPGDKWTHAYVTDDKTGAKKGIANFTLDSFETVKGVETAKILMTFAESEGTPAFTTKQTVWVEKSSGEVVKSEFKFDDLPFGEGPMTALTKGTGTSERLSGGALAGDAGAAAPPKVETIDDQTKDWEKLPGQVTLYKKREAGRLKIMMEIPDAFLNQWMMLQTTASTGNNSSVVAGNPISDILFQFQELEPDKVTVVVPNFWMRADKGTPVNRAVQRSFAESFLESFKVEARQPDRKSFMIDVSELFRGNVSGLFDAMGGGGPLAALGLGGGGGYSPDREKTFVNQIKNFPENLVIQTTYSFNKAGPVGFADMLSQGSIADPRNVVLKVNYNFFALPKSDYMPRYYDPRVGFFTTDYTDFTKGTDQDLTKKLILRWNLKKKDPKAPVSDPVKPIVFWLDNAIPTEYRDTMRDALLSWNKAYELAGISNAVVVKQMPDDADFDHADMRYNVVRWVTSGNNAYAVALFRTNPITGEIINASITVDAGIVQIFAVEAEKIVQPATVALGQNGLACCLPNEARIQASVGLLAGKMMAAMKGIKFDPDAYIKQFVTWVVTHESGHIMGLRHNFIASTELDLSELGDPTRVGGAGTAASVMDYVPFNISAVGKTDLPYWSGIGAYDKWAIQYGYKDLGAISPGGEVSALRKHASMNNTPGLAYQSDETADQWDPQVQRFDLSKHPSEYWARMMELTSKLLQNLDTRAPRPGQSYYEFTRDFMMLYGMHQRAASTAMMSIGGLNLNANWKGDPGQKSPLVPVPAAEQKKALDLLCTNVFGPKVLEIPKRVMTEFASNPNAGFLESILGGSSNFPIMDQVSGFRIGLLQQIFSAGVLSRVANNEYKAVSQDKALTMLSVFSKVSQAVWSELDWSSGISAPRRELQRAYIETMVDMVTKPGDGRPNDAKMLAWACLKQLSVRLKATKETKDAYTDFHVSECLMKVNRALAATLTISDGGGGGGGSLLDQLMGGAKPKQKAKVGP